MAPSLNTRTVQYTFLSLLIMSAPATAAPVAPDAGQTLRQIEQLPSVSTPQEAPATLENKTVRSKAPGSKTPIPVKAIHITGNTVFPETELAPLVSDLAGGDHTLAELDEAAARITAYYHQRGYIVARAYIPAQKIKNGAITIKVIEGIVGKQSINNQSRLSDDHAEAYISHAIRPGDVLQSTPVDRSLLLLADTPGVGGAHTTLRPGASAGTTDLLVDLDPAKAYSGNVNISNFGNRYTGQYLADATVGFNSPLKMGDQLVVRALHSDDRLAYGRISYQVPVGYDGLKLGGSYAQTGYHLGEEFNDLGAHGTAKIASVYAVYPLIRTLSRSLYTTGTLEEKWLNDDTDAPVTASTKNVKNLNLGLAGNNQDTFAGGGVSSFDIALVHGFLSMDAASHSIDDTTAASAGGFTRFTYNINRLQQVTQNNLLWANISGQQASKNLNSSEEISLGGVNGVRAYPENEGNGDRGWLGNLELRHNFASPVSYVPLLQAVAFYDIGSVDINRDPYNTAKNTQTISGAGFGLNVTFSENIQLKTYLAWRTSGGEPLSDPVDRNPRLWFQLSKQF